MKRGERMFEGWKVIRIYMYANEKRQNHRIRKQRVTDDSSQIMFCLSVLKPHLEGCFM